MLGEQPHLWLGPMLATAGDVALADWAGDMHTVLSALQHSYGKIGSAELAELLQPVRDQLPEGWQSRVPNVFLPMVPA